jgi:aldehyde dehydrogenase (NAD(P)+)
VPVDDAVGQLTSRGEGVDVGEVDRRLAVLQEHKSRWARLPIVDKIRYLEDVRALVLRHAEDWVAVGAALKGFDPESPLVGSEEWLGGPYPTVAWLTDVIGTLSAIRTGGDPLHGVGLRTSVGGQVVARVMPAGVYDRLLLSGYDLDVWMQPGVTEQNLRDTVGVFYRQEDPPGRVTLVLGAGNVSAIPMLDTLYSLVADGDVVALKMNPVNQTYGAVFERILAPLIRDGYVQLVYGGTDVGQRLTASDLVEAIHVTGSERTYLAILAGLSEHGPESVTRKPVKPVRAELGGVGPTIVLPGPWTCADIAYQAEHLATQKLHTSGHTCVASQVLILPAGWEHADALLAALRSALTHAPERPSFYPGTAEKQAAFRRDNPTAEALPTQQDRTLLIGVDPQCDHPAFRTELFGPMYVTTALPGDDPATYLRNAVAFANDRLHGNLGANLIVHPQTVKELGPVLDEAIEALRYGSIGVNAWSAFVFLAGRGAWGAYPGNTAQDIQSGTGVVHNSLLFDQPQKNVVRAPFRPFPRSARHLHSTLAVKPPWFVTNRTATATARRLTHFAADPQPQRLVGLFASALRG